MCRAAALALLTAAAAVAQPSLDSFSVSSERVESRALVFDLTDGPGVLRLSASASSAQAKVEGISVSMTVLDHFGGTAHRAVPTIAGGSGTVDYVLPRFLETGTYRLNVAVRDAAGQTQRWTPDELAAAGLPSQFTVRVADDLSGPIVVAVAVDPVADPAAPRGTARFTFNDPSGILAYRVIVRSPSGTRRVLAEHRSSVGVGPGHTFQTAFDLSGGTGAPVEEGRWTIAEVRTVDSNGTAQTLTTRDLVNLGLQASVAVGDVPPDATGGPACGVPNPVPAGVTVRLPATADVYDVRGRRVARTSPEGALPTAGLGAGVYLVRSGVEGEPACRFTVRPR